MHIDSEHHREVRKTGHNWLDLMIAMTALFISATSLIVTIVHSQTLERMADANAKLVEANSWPFIEYNTTNGQTVSMSIVNDGIGPAKVEAIEIRWKGKAQRDAADFLTACCGFAPASARPNYDIVSGQVLRAGQSASLLDIPHTAADTAAWNSLNRARLSRDLSVNVCYCSIFDQCWQTDIVRLSLKPQQMRHCNVPAVPYEIAR